MCNDHIAPFLYFFYQYPALSDPYKFILITILILMTLIEIIRLFLGYAGNLQEKVLHHKHKHKHRHHVNEALIVHLAFIGLYRP